MGLFWPPLSHSLFFSTIVFGLYFGGVFNAMKRFMVYVWEISRRNKCFILVFALGTKRILEESKQKERPKAPFCNCVIKSRRRL
jgi:hypothetical protein